MRFPRPFSMFVVLLIMLTGMVPLTAFAQSFPDVPEGSEYYGAVTYLKDKGVISGYPDGTFKPDRTINRAEALKMTMIASSSQSGTLSTQTFPDVTEDQWFYEPVQVALQKGIIEGYDDGTFKPGNNINVAESIKIILLSFSVDVGNPPGTDPYPDVDQQAWYSAYAAYAKTRQLVWPLGDGMLHAGRDITRGEFADIIYRFMYITENNYDKFPLNTDWPTYIHPTDEYSLKYPFHWEHVTAGNQDIFWKRDEENNQLSWARLYPNGATAVIAVDANDQQLSLDEYFALITYDSSAVIQSQTLNEYPFKSVYIASTNTFDYYFEMPNGNIVVVYAQVGGGLDKPQLIEEVRNLVGSIRYHEGPAPTAAVVTDNEKFLAQIRENILVEGKGQEMVDLLGDGVLINTDSIGIGTGPVDYYYSAAHNVTLKIERDSDTILAISEEKSTAF